MPTYLKIKTADKNKGLLSAVYLEDQQIMSPDIAGKKDAMSRLLCYLIDETTSTEYWQSISFNELADEKVVLGKWHNALIPSAPAPLKDKVQQMIIVDLDHLL